MENERNQMMINSKIWKLTNLENLSKTIATELTEKILLNKSIKSIAIELTRNLRNQDFSIKSAT